MIYLDVTNATPESKTDVACGNIIEQAAQLAVSEPRSPAPALASRPSLRSIAAS